MYFGVAYYPEHWPRERWNEDARLMKEAGINAIRVGEFAWSWMEPEEGNYDLGWLDEAIELFAGYGIKTVLGTPTATPPKWLTAKHADILPMNEFGRRANHGGRRHCCLNSPTYMLYTKKIVEKLSSHYADNEAVVGWQIDNELGNPYCYCDTCQQSFEEWLKKKYESLEDLNQRWGNAFWSTDFTAWEQIPLPCGNVGDVDHNPTMKLEYRRFYSDTVCDYIALQAKILKRVTPHKFVTHNFLDPGPGSDRELFEKLDYYKAQSSLDFTSYDNYPHGEPARTAFCLDIMRGVGGGSFSIMEQKCGSGAAPGQIRLWFHQAIARGAESIFFFRWRPFPFGQEQEKQRLLDYDGKPNRRYEEIKQSLAEARKVSDVVKPFSLPAKVAMLHSYEERWAFRSTIPPSVYGNYDYVQNMMDIYKVFYQKATGIDIINMEDGEFQNYKVLIAPAMLIMNDHVAKRLTDFVEGGGILIATCLTSRKNWENIVNYELLHPSLKRLFGVEIVDYDYLYDEQVPVSFCRKSGQETYQASQWAEILKTTSAESLATYEGKWYEGKTCSSQNTYGRGKAIYIGAVMNNAYYASLVDWIDEEIQSAKPPFAIPDGIEVKEFSYADGKSGFFILNPTPTQCDIDVQCSCRDLISDKKIDSQLVLPPFGVSAILTTD